MDIFEVARISVQYGSVGTREVAKRTKIPFCEEIRSSSEVSKVREKRVRNSISLVNDRKSRFLKVLPSASF